MKKLFSKALVLSLLLSVLLPFTSSAAGSTSIRLSKDNPVVGDSFSVTVIASESGQMKVSFDSRVLEIIGTTAQGQSTSNSLTFTAKEATITFKAKAEGRSGVIVESSSLSGSSINVTVGAAASSQAQTPAPEPAPQQTETPAPEATEPETQTDTNVSEEPPATSGQVPEGSDFLVDGVGMVVSERYKDSDIPAGFTETRLEINGKSVRELTNGTMTLVYLKPTENTEGEGVFYVYNMAEGTVRRMDLVGAMTDYVILSTPDTFFTKRLVQTEINLGDTFVSDVYTIEGSNSEFYYVYGMDETGGEGWFAYDSLTGRVNRADIMSLALIDEVSEPQVAPEEPEKEESSGFSLPFEIPDFIKSKTFIIILASVLIVIILIAIIVSVIRRRNEEDYWEDEDYEDEDMIEDDEPLYEPPTQSLFDKKKPEFNVDEEPRTSILEPDDNLIDDLIKKAGQDGNGGDIDIIDLDDL